MDLNPDSVFTCMYPYNRQLLINREKSIYSVLFIYKHTYYIRYLTLKERMKNPDATIFLSKRFCLHYIFIQFS